MVGLRRDRSTGPVDAGAAALAVGIQDPGLRLVAGIRARCAVPATTSTG